MFEQDDDFDFDEGFLEEIIAGKNVQSRLQENVPLYHNVNSIISESRQSTSNKDISSHERRLTENNFLFRNEEIVNTKSDSVHNVDHFSKRKSTNNYMTHSKKLCSKQSVVDTNQKNNFLNSVPEHRPIHNILSIVRNDNATLFNNNSDSKQTSVISSLADDISKNLNSTNIEKNYNSRILNKNINDTASLLKDNLYNREPINSFRRNECFSTVIPAKVQKRRFPGPAGLLADCISPFLCLTEQVVNSTTNNSVANEVNIYSQSTADLFNGQLWQQMLKDYGVTKNSRTVTLPKKYTIAWLKRNANVRKLIKQKSPFLAAIVDNVEHFDENHSVLLKDQTGDIRGVFNDEVWNKYGKSIQCGSVIVLKQIGVLTTNLVLKRHYLNITVNSIVVIYSSNDNSTENVDHQLTTECDFETTLGEQFMSSIDLINEIEKVMTDYRNEINRGNNKFFESYCRTNSSESSVVNNVRFEKPKHILNNPKSLNVINKGTVAVSKPQMNTKMTSYNSFAAVNLNVFVSNNTIPGSVSTNPLSIRPELRSLLFNRQSANSSNNMLTKLEQSKFPSTKASSTVTSCNLIGSGNNASKSDIESILDSTLDGIDTDSLFEDF